MAKNLCVWGGVVLSLMLLAACSTPRKAPPVVAQAVVQNPGQKAITVSGDKAGASIVLDRAQELVVRLALDPVTGLEWSLVDLKPGVLTLLSSKFERPLRNTNGEEAPGIVVWRFLPEASGNVELKFDLRRPRNVAPAVQTLTYTVTVK